MKVRRRFLCFPVLSFLLLLSAGCTAYIGEYGPSPYCGKDSHFFTRLTESSMGQADTEGLAAVLAGDEELTVRDGDAASKSAALQAPLILRFVWFSDVQVRQQEVKLFSDEDSRRLDAIIPSFEHNQIQEDFDWALYLSQIKAANRLGGVDFMIHTGDGIDAGTIEELYQFIYISNQSKVPWLNAVGNHDVSIFGNYRERMSYTRQAGVGFYPVGNVPNFIWMHRPQREISGFGRYLLPTPSEGGHSPSEDGNGKLAGTFHHGFDMQPGVTSTAEKFDYDRASGYYATDLRTTSLPVRVIVLNSANTEAWGASGIIAPAQRDWLRRQLLPEGRGINLVFSHHRPRDFDEQTRAVLAGSGHSPLVAFTGHTHQHNLLRHEDGMGHGYFELNTGSVLEFPQIGRVIELRGTPDGPVWLVSRALWSSFMKVRDMPSLDETDSVLKECADRRDAILDAIVRNEAGSFRRAVACAHYGAYQDFRKDKSRLLGKPQNFDEAWHEANVIIQVVP